MFLHSREPSNTYCSRFVFSLSSNNWKSCYGVLLLPLESLNLPNDNAFQSRVVDMSAAAQQMKSESFLRGSVDAATAELRAWWVSCGLHMRCVALGAGAGGASLAKMENLTHG